MSLLLLLNYCYESLGCHCRSSCWSGFAAPLTHQKTRGTPKEPNEGKQSSSKNKQNNNMRLAGLASDFCFWFSRDFWVCWFWGAQKLNKFETFQMFEKFETFQIFEMFQTFEKFEPFPPLETFQTFQTVEVRRVPNVRNVQHSRRPKSSKSSKRSQRSKRSKHSKSSKRPKRSNDFGKVRKVPSG